MNYLILILVFTLLSISIFFYKKDQEKWLWITIPFLFLSYFFSFNIGFIKIPIGILIGYILIKKYSHINLSLKYQTLLFSLTLFVVFNYIMPYVNLNSNLMTYEQYKIINRFESVQSFNTYTVDSSIQNIIRENGNDPGGIFRTWVFNNRNIIMNKNSKDWFWISSPNELKFHYSYTIDDVVAESYINFYESGEDYLGVLKKTKDGDYYLSYAVKGKLKSDKNSNSITNIFN